MKPPTRFLFGNLNANPVIGGGEATAPSSEGKTMAVGTAEIESGGMAPPTRSDEGGDRRRELMEKPPADDVCPICFGSLVVPCRAPCGHWYCGSCILQYWKFGAALQPCKCPMCSRRITKLMPEASLYHRREVEIRKVLHDIGGYNRLFVGGISGFMLGVFHAIPLYIKRRFHQMLYSDRPLAVQNYLRIIAIYLGLLYSFLPDFLHIGDENMGRVFDYTAIALGFIVSIVGVYLRSRRERNLRELANMHDEQD